jgi:hypothetical protein
MKKPVQRAILLEDVLADLIHVQETLLRLQISNQFDALSNYQNGSTMKCSPAHGHLCRIYPTMLRKSTVPRDY